MEMKILAERKEQISSSEFWNGLNILMTNPHLINKRILSSAVITKKKLDNVALVIDKIVNSKDEESNIPSEVVDLPEAIDDDDDDTFLLIKNLFPKDDVNFSQSIEFLVVDKRNNRIVFLSKVIDKEKKCLSIDWPYEITYKGDGDVAIAGQIDGDEKKIGWLVEKLFFKVIKWMKSSKDFNGKQSLVEGSLNVIPVERYCLMYNDLKKKYGLELVKKWSECTDPQKFVYEDVAIATYLLILWEEERKEKRIHEKQSFVDLGCGNGLLAYILTNEGHPGVGIDLRKRKIWDLFLDSTKLEEKTIIPSSKFLFPDTDWLIGNHSDELTPWIPVIASRSSYQCRFFLLPCCAHEFDGRKFQRGSALNSQYHEYLKYIKHVCDNCGFKTKLDKLRIPSTKRICFIGWERTYLQSEIDQQDKLIEQMICARSVDHKIPEKDINDVWSHDFKPRDSIEKVRNCTQVDKSVINQIINLVTEQLLKKVRIISVDGDREKRWNAGGRIELAEVAKIIPTSLLKKIKNECGGIQTLFKNNSNIFDIVDGAVQFRIPGTDRPRKKNKNKLNNIQFQVKPCWFFHNHPDGCPLNHQKCTFKH